MIRKTFLLILCLLLSFLILAACAKPMEVVTLIAPTDTQVPPTPTLEPSPTASSINELPITERVSIDSYGTQANNDSDRSSISDDERYVAFSSSADNLVEGDTNGVQDVFVHYRVTGETTRVSVASDGTQANGACATIGCWCILSGLSISADGRYIAFHSDATNLVEGDTNGVTDIFVNDRVTGETTLVSVSSEGAQGNGGSSIPAISGDGRYVAFISDSTNLVEGVTNGGIFVHDRVTGETTVVSVSSDGTQGNEGAGYPSISADGRYVAFSSFSNNLVQGDINGGSDCFVHDRMTGETTLESVSSDGRQGNGWVGATAISADGRYVAFWSDPDHLVEGDTNEGAEWFVHDRVTGDTILASVPISNDETQGKYGYIFSTVSADGRCWTFISDASNLVEGDTNGVNDVFVRCLGTSEQPIPRITELYGVWTGFWSTDYTVLMEFIATMRPRVGFEEDVVYPGDDTGREWFNVEDGILTFGAWVKGAWVKPFSASTDCINNPQATYEVYITSLDDQPKTLRFVLVGEDHCIDRQTFLDGQTLTWVGTYPP